MDGIFSEKSVDELMRLYIQAVGQIFLTCFFHRQICVNSDLRVNRTSTSKEGERRFSISYFNGLLKGVSLITVCSLLFRAGLMFSTTKFDQMLLSLRVIIVINVQQTCPLNDELHLFE